MDNLVVERKTKNTIRNMIADALSSSVMDLRNYYNSDIVAVIDKLDFSTPFVPDNVFKGELFREKDLNDFLDYIYLDLLIQYGDLYTLRDYLERLRSMFVSTVVPQMVKAGETSANVRNLTKLKDTQYAFTDIISESFNYNINTYPYSEKLKINPGAGIIRLDGKEKNYASPEYMNVRIDVISTGCKVIDSSDELNAYNNDALSPFYINAISSAAPINTDRGILEFADYQGIVCDIVISFPDIIPVSRIGLTQFSDAPFEVIQLQSSTMTNQNIHYSGFDVIPLRDVSYDNNEIELNFNSVNAREIHIFVLQNKYKSTREAVEIAKFKHISDYLNNCSTILRSIDNKGFAENEDITLQLQQLFSEIRKNSQFPKESIRENIRSYTIGFYNLKVSNVTYNPTGYYTTGDYDVNGNVMNLSFNYEGIPVVIDNEQMIAAALFYTELANNRFYMGVLNEDQKVYDISTFEANLVYDLNGELVLNTDYPIKFYTNFLPATNYFGGLNNFKIHFDDNQIALNFVNSDTDLSVYNCTVYLKDSVVKQYNLNEGVTVVTEYYTEDEDCYGNPYSPSEVDVVARIGKPNLVNHRILPVENSYLYVNTTISGETYEIGYSEEQYGRVALSGDLYYSIGIGKGEITDFPRIVNVTKEGVSNKYVRYSSCSCPIDNVYAAIMNEPLISGDIFGTSVQDGKTYLKYRVDHPYMKSTIKVYEGSVPVKEMIEYRDDIYGNIVPLSDETVDKKTVYLLSGDYADLKAHYVPIGTSYTGMDIQSNIASHNITETFGNIPAKGVKLGRYPYLDMDIVNSESFSVKDGVFTYQPLFSIIYEPLAVYVNGNKAKNITRYRSTDPEIDKRLAEISREDEYMYYLTEDGIIIPSKEMTGNITIQYYSLSDSLRAGIQMSKSNLYRDDLTPELYDFTILANVKR